MEIKDQSNDDFAEKIESQNPAIEAIYKINIGFSLSESEAKEALLHTLSVEDPSERSALLGTLLNGLMSKRPEVDEVVGLIKAALSLDNFNIDNIKEIDIPGEKVIGVAGSGKKGIKTSNVSSCACFVAAAAGAYVMKTCSSSTSSLTGSLDFIKRLGVKIEISVDEMEKVLRKTGIGFFEIEGQIKKFDSFYGGKFYAPHALSYALSAIVLPIRPNIMFYGLSHPGVVTSMKVLEKFGYKNSFVVASTDDGLHYMDEVCVFGTTYVCGNRNGKLGKASFIQTANVLNLPNYTRNDIAPADDVESNILMGLNIIRGLGDSAREDMVCVNSATILYLSGKVKDLKTGYVLSKKVISEGGAFEKLKDFIIATGGNLDSINELIKYEKSFI